MRVADIFYFSGLLVVVGLTACSTLPKPRAVEQGTKDGRAAATQLVARCAARHGEAWQKGRVVEVGYEGQWSALSGKIQPVLADVKFRRTSVEVYRPRAMRVSQTHRGPSGIKTVEHRRGGPTVVTYNGKRELAADKLAAAGLVAEAYMLFTYGSSWLAAESQPLKLLSPRMLGGERCDLVVCRLPRGLGSARPDTVIAWIGQSSTLLRRVQFSLEALESTRGADVDVAFSAFVRARDGSVWPTAFLEFVRRPILFKAHEWRTVSLALNGRRVAVDAAARAQ